MLARKYRIHIFLALVALIIIVYPYYAGRPDQQRLDDSGAAAYQFLRLVDEQHYEQSWNICAAYLKEAVSLEQWQQQLATVRSAAGALKERKQVDYTYTRETKKGVPEGEYMVYSYASNFTNKADVKETVTLLLSSNGNWQVAGYFIE